MDGGRARGKEGRTKGNNKTQTHALMFQISYTLSAS